LRSHKTFTVVCEAELMFLVAQDESCQSKVFPMQEIRKHLWQANVDLEPGVYRMRYYSGNQNFVSYFAPVGTVTDMQDGLDGIVVIGDEETSDKFFERPREFAEQVQNRWQRFLDLQWASSALV
jgi:hypothetical protein